MYKMNDSIELQALRSISFFFHCQTCFNIKLEICDSEMNLSVYQPANVKETWTVRKTLSGR